MMIAINAQVIIPNIKGPTLLTCSTLLKSVLFSSSAIYMNNHFSADLAGFSSLTTVHLLPVKIFYDGPANVENFIQENGEKGTLYGRALESTPQELPTGYTAHIVRISSEDRNSKCLRGESQVTKLMEWGHDESPNEYSQVNSVLRYLDVITKMHLS